MKKSLIALLTATILIGCNPKENLPTSKIEMPNREQLTQMVFADQMSTSVPIQFTTSGAWNSSIREVVTNRSLAEEHSRANDSLKVPDWITVSPSSGDKAGNYSMSVTLSANLTGMVRSAQISLYCEGETVVVSVTQEPKTADGKLPSEAIKGEGSISNGVGLTANLVSATHTISAPGLVRIGFVSPAVGTSKSEVFMVDMANALSDGRLAAGTYVAGAQNGASFNFIKSSLGGYSQSGTIVVARSGENYTFAFDFATDDNKRFTGRYEGQLLYLNTEIKVSDVRLDPSNVEIEIGRTVTLRAIVVPENALNRKITWASSDSTVAKVDQSGVVQAVQAGTVIVTATAEDGGHKGSCLIAVAGVSTTGNGSFKHTGTKQEIFFSKVVHSVSGYRNVILDFYSPANDLNFQLSFLTALSNGRLPGGTYTYNSNLGADNSFFISKTYLGGNPISGTALVQVSGDQYTVALDVQLETDKTGMGGKITGSYIGRLDYPSPFVSVASVGLNKTALEFERGASETLVATVLPANASHKVVRWSSSDSTVVSVFPSGSVYASAVGTATIRATTQDGNHVASCVITVKAPETTGSGTFTYTLDGKGIETFQVVRVVKDSNSNTIRFYDANQQEGAYFNYNTSSGTLETGTYQWDSVKNAPLRWHSQKGSFGKTNYYCEGVDNPGTIIVGKSGNSYSITFNWNVKDGEFALNGTIKGTYTGTIKGF